MYPVPDLVQLMSSWQHELHKIRSLPRADPPMESQ